MEMSSKCKKKNSNIRKNLFFLSVIYNIPEYACISVRNKQEEMKERKKERKKEKRNSIDPV